MRVIITIILILQVSFVNGQAGNRRVFTIEEALNLPLKNNPVALTISDRKKLSNDIKSAWYLWLFRIHKWRTLQDYEYLLGDLDRIAAARFQAGDVDLLEKSTFITRLAEVKTESAVLSSEIEISANLLKSLLFVDDEIAPADSVLSIYEVDKGLSEKLLPYDNLNVSVLQDSLTEEYHRFTVANSIENLRLGLDGLFIRLSYYHSFGLPHAETILKTSQAKFNAEEIDYLEFTENIAEAFRIRLGYLETLNNYNQSAIHLEYYAY